VTDTLTRAELALAYAKELLASFREDAPTAAEVIGPMPALAVVTDGRAWVAVSARLADLLGQHPADLLGIAWRDYVHPDDHAASVRAAEDLLRAPEVPGGPVVEGQFVNRYATPGGWTTLHWRWAKASPTRPWVIAIAEIVVG
jgi:PAS domain-containing protein